MQTIKTVNSLVCRSNYQEDTRIGDYPRDLQTIGIREADHALIALKESDLGNRYRIRSCRI